MHVLVFPAPLEVAPEALVPTFSKLLGALGRALLMPLLVVALVGCPRHSGPDTTLPLVTTENRAAEEEVRAAREAADAGRAEEAVQRTMKFDAATGGRVHTFQIPVAAQHVSV